MVLGNAHENMRGALLVAERAAHRRGTQPLPARTFVDVRLAHEEPVDVERRAGIIGLRSALAMALRSTFSMLLCGALRRVAQRLQRVLSLLPADQIDHQARLLRRHAHVPCKRVASIVPGVLVCSSAINYAFGARVLLPARRLLQEPRRRPSRAPL